MDKDKKLFPQRLWDLVHDERYNHFLRWSDDGQRVYLNRNDFEEQYLRTPLNQFHTQKAISFVRQMNMYGFKKVDDCHYENDNFKRGCHHLIKHMVRRNSNRPHMTTTTAAAAASLAFSNGHQSMNTMRGSLICRGGDGGGGGGGLSSVSGNQNSSFNQRHHGISGTMITSDSGRQVPDEGLSPAARRQLAGGATLVGGANTAGRRQHMTAIGGGAGCGLDESQNNNLRALYEQLVTLNQMNATPATQTTNHESPMLGLSNSSMIQQLARSSAQLNSLIGRNQSFVTNPIAVTTPPLPTTTTTTTITTTTTTSTTSVPNIAHSSMASSLYQRLAMPVSRVGGGYIFGDSCPMNATTTVTTTLPAPHIPRAYNDTASSVTTQMTGLDEAVRSMLATQNLVEAANRDAQLMAAAAVAAPQQSDRSDLVGMTMNHPTRSLAAQQLLQQTLIGSLMQLRLAPQLPRPSLSGASSIAQNYQDLNFLLNQNQSLSAAVAQTQHAQMLQNQSSIGTLATDDVRMDEGTSECEPAGRALGPGAVTAPASCSSSSSTSSRNTSSRSSVNLQQSMSNEMLRRNLDQCSARHLPGCSGGGGGDSGSSNLSRSLAGTGGESDSECLIVTDDDEEHDRHLASQRRNSKESAFQLCQQQQQSHQARPAPSAHCMSRRQLEGALINLSCGGKRENSSV